MNSRQSVGIIAAVSTNGVIGITNSEGKPALPFNYPADMKYFRETTKNAVVIMGRKTFESIGKPLPKRRNMVISRSMSKTEGVEIFPSIKEATDRLDHDLEESLSLFEASDMNMIVLAQSIWFCGGASIYEEAMQYATEIHLTVTPDIIANTNAVRFPWINPRMFELKEWRRLELANDTLQLCIYRRI
jgi:dihydrofolate reductase